MPWSLKQYLVGAGIHACVPYRNTVRKINPSNSEPAGKIFYTRLVISRLREQSLISIGSMLAQYQSSAKQPHTAPKSRSIK